MTKIRKYLNAGSFPDFSHTNFLGLSYTTLGDQIGNFAGGNAAEGFNIQANNLISGISSDFILGAFNNPLNASNAKLLESGLNTQAKLFNNELNTKYHLNEVTNTPSPVKSFLTKNADTIGNVADLANNFSDTVFGLKKGLSGPHSELTAGIDSAYNSASDAMMKINPMVGGIMKAAGFVGNTINKLGGGTDGKTSMDAALNSAPGTLLTLGLNGFLGDTTESFSKNEEAFAQVGSSYGGTGSVVDDALSKANAKYGLVSGGARTEANRLIRKAKTQLQVMGDIADASVDSSNIQSSMSAINGNRRAFQLQGGLKLSSVRVGRNGLSLLNFVTAKRVVSSYKMALKMSKGGKSKDPYTEYLNTLPDYLLNDTNYRVKDYWLFNGLPKDFQEAIDKGMFIQLEDGWHAGSVSKNPETGEIEFMKSSSHPTHNAEIEWYNSNDPKAIEFKKEWELQKTEPYWKYVNRWAIKLNRSLKDLIEYAKQENPRFILRMSEPVKYIDLDNGLKGTHLMSSSDNIVFPMILEIDGSLKQFDNWKEAYDSAIKNNNVLIFNNPEEAELFAENYKEGWPEFFKLFKSGGVVEFEPKYTILREVYNLEDYLLLFLNGGTFNIIPEGALHARLNHMDNDNVTKKGIPVVSEMEGGQIEQQAEIEREELILRLDVTKKLEELAKEGSDDSAIEAGKLLTYEILHNTVDNTLNLL